ncbi:MAG: hypothetical protein AB7P24_10865 [Nitrospira sp.]
MSAEDKYMLDFEELVALMLKKYDIHEGIWGLSIEFRFGAGNIGDGQNIRPTIVAGVNKIGLQKFPQENEIAFDAAKLNPVRRGIINTPAESKS